MSRETEQIERTLEDTRDRLGRNLDELTDRLSPGRVLDEAMQLFDTGPKGMATALGNQVRSNPLATIITGAGLAWLAFGQKSVSSDSPGWPFGNWNSSQASNSNAAEKATDRDGDHDRDWDDETAWSDVSRYSQLETIRRTTPRSADDTDATYSQKLDDAYAKVLEIKRNADETMESYRERVRSSVDGARDRANQAKERLYRAAYAAPARAGEVGRQAGDAADTAKRRAISFHEENPLVAGLVAAAAGAVAGSLFPVSQRERETLKPLADQVVEKGAELAETAADKVDQAAQYGKKKADDLNA